jgi:hypothetical protein
MEHWSESQIEWTPDWDDEPPTFKVVIIYEDGPTGRRAKLFYDKLIDEFETNTSLVCSCGASRFSQFRKSENQPQIL